MPRMVLLGVGTAVPDVDREHTHMLWDGPGGPLLIDTGGSTYQRLLRADIDPRNLQAIVLTHTHADHINGLPALLFSLYLAGRRTSIPVYGLESTLNLVRHILDAFQLEEYATPVTWKPIVAGESIPLPASEHTTGTWVLSTALTRHSRPCLGLRFEDRSSGKALAYSCDTAPCPAVTDLMHAAQVIIHEATSSEPSEMHSTPYEAGAAALQAGAHWLIIVHYSPRYTMSEVRALADIRASGFTGRAEIGRELQIIEL